MTVRISFLVDETLRLNGVDCTEVDNIEGMAEKGVYIMTFWNDIHAKKGFHTIAVENDGNGNYQPYNYSEEGPDQPMPESVFKATFPGRFIVAYRIK